MIIENTVENSQGRKLIKASTIKGVQASFKSFTDTLPKKNETALIEAPVTSNFEIATKKVKSSMESLTETVQSLDVYLNGVADTFVSMDLAISNGINNGVSHPSVGPYVKPFGETSIYSKPPVSSNIKKEDINQKSKYLDVLPGR